VGLYGLGTVTSSAAVGVFLGWLGAGLPDLVRGFGWRPVLALTAALAVVDLRRRSYRAFGLRRQTNPRWRARFGPRLAALLWGLDLGLGFSTIRTTSLFWLVGFLVFLQESPLRGGLTLSVYGLTLVFNLLWGNRRYLRRGLGPAATLKLMPRMRSLSAIAMMAWAGVVVALQLR
jgi:hypothetical protein